MQALLDTLAPSSDEWKIAATLDPSRLPAHVAVIMDGNGRWARQRSLPRVAGHKAGVEPVRTTVESCARLGIESLTLYAFSVENWKRPQSEVETLWRLLRYYLHREMPALMKNGIRFRAIGRIAGLPAAVRREIAEVMEQTAGNPGMTLNVAINYGGRSEIVDAVNTLMEQARREGRLDTLRMDEDLLATALQTAGQPEPDLLIRTSGEMRISNFLLWQIAYAELYVTETLWPDFDRKELFRAIQAYQKRDRRFGGITPSHGQQTLDEPLLEAVPVPTR